MFPDRSDFSELKYSPPISQHDISVMVNGIRNGQNYDKIEKIIKIIDDNEEYICILNVGGKRFECSSYVLRKIPYFCNWLERWADTMSSPVFTKILDLSKHFIDRSPKIFDIIYGQFSKSDKIDPKLYAQRKEECEFYGIYIAPLPVKISHATLFTKMFR